MANFAPDITGWDGIGGKIDAWVADKVAKAGNDVITIAEETADVMQGLVRVRSGDLQNSIHVENAQVRANGAEVVISATMGYAGFQEYGTRYMVGKPYFNPGIAYFKSHLQQFVVFYTGGVQR